MSQSQPPQHQNPQHPYWLALSLVKGLGYRHLLRLVEAFGSPKAAWEAPPSLLDEIEASPTLKDGLLSARRKLDLDQEMARVQAAQAYLLTFDDPQYPANLKTIDAPPPVLYVRGELRSEDELAITVVGTRSASSYGREATFRLARELAIHGVTVVSGLAYGVDSAAHHGALAGSGRTIAVFGCGIDRVYPTGNAALAEEILDKRAGAWITEFPIGTPPSGSNFPRRNRTMAGLARAVLVTEAPEGSGALLTADAALEQGRDVFALPSNILNRSGAGTNHLIQDGARLITSVEDILDELQIKLRPRSRKPAAAVQPTAAEPPQPQPPADVPPLNTVEKRLMELLTPQPCHIDDLIRRSHLRADEVISAMTLLELKGLASMVGPMQYCRS
ncbi:DNA-processing protein DprA [Aggregatilineales bacterium SYSU G02658]